MILALLAIVITLILVIGIHEAGHALAAKLLGVKIQRIAIGFGKPLFRWQDKRGIEWVWGRWPAGGYVQLLNTRIQPVEPADFKQCFDKKPIWIRCIILLAGALANLLTAWLAFIIMFMVGSQQHSPIIATITPQSIAAQAALKKGDRFVTIDEKQINSWPDVGMQFIMALGKKNIPVTVRGMDGVLRNSMLDASAWVYKKQTSLLSSFGIEPDKKSIHTVPGVSFFKAVILAFQQCTQLLFFFLVLFKQLLSGAIPFAMLLGPLGLLSSSIGSFTQGIAVFMNFIASLSLAVGLVNLFPIPGLDGGSIVYALIEKIRGKPVSIAWELLLHRLAVIAFVLILVQLINNDLQRYFS